MTVFLVCLGSSSSSSSAIPSNRCYGGWRSSGCNSCLSVAWLVALTASVVHVSVCTTWYVAQNMTLKLASQSMESESEWRMFRCFNMLSDLMYLSLAVLSSCRSLAIARRPGQGWEGGGSGARWANGQYCTRVCVGGDICSVLRHFDGFMIGTRGCLDSHLDP